MGKADWADAGTWGRGVVIHWVAPNPQTSNESGQVAQLLTLFQGDLAGIGMWVSV